MTVAVGGRPPGSTAHRPPLPRWGRHGVQHLFPSLSPPRPRSFCSKDVPGVSSMGLAYQRLQKAWGGGCGCRGSSRRSERPRPADGPAPVLLQRPGQGTFLPGPPKWGGLPGGRGDIRNTPSPSSFLLLPHPRGPGTWLFPGRKHPTAPGSHGLYWGLGKCRVVALRTALRARGRSEGHRQGTGPGGGGGGPQPLLTSPLLALR